ncbi:MAG TPA: hypothetical protein VFC84_15930 [Desulfosporosinus sp.]|nr:hypothetical protein [Desulfosporosinus sp.]
MKELMFVVFLLVFSAVISKAVARIRGFSPSMVNEFINPQLFYNNGNVRLPLIALVSSSELFLVNGEAAYLTYAITVQAIVLIVQNMTLNTLGLYNASKGSRPMKESLKGMLRLPVVLILPLVLIFKYFILYDLTAFQS